MRLIFSCFLLLFTGFLARGQTTDDIEAELLTDSGVRIRRGTCYEASLRIFKNGEEVGGVASECYDQYTYEITICDNCFDSSPSFGIHCYDQVSLSFEGVEIGSFWAGDAISPVDNNPCRTFTGSFSEFNMDDLGYPTFQVFTITINSTCYDFDPFGPNLNWSFINTIELPFNFVSQLGNNTYTRGYWGAETDVMLEVLDCDWDGKPICCNSTSYFSIVESGSITNTKTTSATGSVSIQSGLSFGALGLSNSIVGSFTISQTSATAVASSFSFSINERIWAQEGLCVVPGYQLVKRAFIEETYAPDCDGTEVYVPGSQVKHYIPIYVIPYHDCTYEPVGGCPPPPTPEPTKGINGGGFLAARTTPPCTGFIDLGIDDVEGLVVGWTGPNGFTSNEFFIDGLEIGEYHYEITNECCDQITGTVVLCDELEYTPWVYDIVTMEYCRIVTCEDPVTSVARSPDCETYECVMPDDIVENFDGTDCIQEHYYGGEYLGFVVVESVTSTIEFDDFTGQCTKLFYCGGDVVDEQTDFPQFGPWQFDFATEQCTRTVICFDQELEEPQTEVPDIVETYNEFNGLCERTAYCEGLPILLPPNPPFITGPWMWSEFEGCTRDVQCSFDSEIVSISGQESFSNWDFNEFTNMCESSVSCDNLNMPGAVHTEFPQSIGVWTFNNSMPFDQQCRRQIWCSGNIITEYTSPNFPAGPTCQCNNGGTAASYYIYCENTYIDFIPCPDPNDCFTENDPEESKNLVSQSGVSIFPNPVVDDLYFSGFEDKQAYSVKLYSVYGSEYLSAVLKSNKLSLKDIPSGTYFLQLFENDQLIATQKFVKI